MQPKKCVIFQVSIHMPGCPEFYSAPDTNYNLLGWCGIGYPALSESKAVVIFIFILKVTRRALTQLIDPIYYL